MDLLVVFVLVGALQVLLVLIGLLVKLVFGFEGLVFFEFLLFLFEVFDKRVAV